MTVTTSTSRPLLSTASDALRGGAGVWPGFAVVLLAALLVEPRFFDPQNLDDTLTRTAILGVVALGQVLVLITGGIDLSVPAVIVITAVTIAETTGPDGPGLFVGLLIAAGFAVGVGLTNGLLITGRGVPPFVATFGMFVTLEGARLAWTKGQVSGSIPSGLVSFGQSNAGPVPVIALLWIALVAGLTLAIRRTVAGRQLVLTGANETMAVLSGVPTRRLKISAYVGSALLAALAGVFFTSFIGYVDRFIGRGTDLDSVTVALLGGATFAGGRGSFVHAAGGALLLTSLLNLIVIAGWNNQLQLVAKGLVLIAAVALQRPWSKTT